MSETTWRLVPDREADRIRIGDRVRVASTYRFYEDWKDVDLEVVGIACTPLGDLNYTLSEDWPRDGGFDDWRERDLVVVSAPKPPAGLYEVREDGTARRVEVDGALIGIEITFKRLLEAGQYMMRAFDHVVNELPAHRDRASFPGLQLMVREDAEIRSMAEARAVLEALTGEER